MKKRKKKNGITLLALVITIVIMLLLAGVAIQMTMGENGLIAKSVQAQKEQAKAELYDTAKLSYTSLNAKALENGQPSPQAELALSTTEFTSKYNVVGDDITDKKGTVIDTKENVLKAIMGETSGSTTTGGSVTPGTTPVPSTPAESWPKTVAGVTIPEEEKEKMILKLKVIDAKAKIYFSRNDGKIIDYGTGNHTERADGVEFYNGEHIIKISKFESLSLEDKKEGDYEVEILQWGKITGNPLYDFEIHNVSKVYEPEPDKVAISYVNAKFTEIPEWLFSKKVTSEVMSKFHKCTGLTSIPEGLFKNNVNAKYFGGAFFLCKGLTSIPEGLFKNNVNATGFDYTFKGCTGLTSIPEGLFKNNVKAERFWGAFESCTGLTSIPGGLFKNNVNATGFHNTFESCTGLISIPEGLFKNNVKAEYFVDTFKGCTGLTSIPEGLFDNNVNAKSLGGAFKGSTGLTSIPEKIIEFGKKVKEKGGIVSSMFYRCTSASNYNSIPNYLK